MSDSSIPVDLDYFKRNIDCEKTVNEIFRKATHKKNPHLFEEYKASEGRINATLYNLYLAWYLKPWTVRGRVKLYIKPGPSSIKEKLLSLPEHIKLEYEQKQKKREKKRKENQVQSIPPVESGNNINENIGANGDDREMFVIDLTEDGSDDANELLPAESSPRLHLPELSNTNASIGSDIGKITKLAKKKQESKSNQLPTIENGKTNETAEFAGQIAAYIARSKNLAEKIYKLSEPDYDVKCSCVHKYICLNDFLKLTNVRKVLGKNRVEIYEWYLKFLKKDESTLMALNIRSLLVAELYKRPNLCDLCYQCIRLNIQDYANDKAREAQQDEVAAAAAATATSAATTERKSHNVTHNDVIITLDSSSDTSGASDTNQSNVMHSNTVSNIQNNITASSNANVPVADAIQLSPSIDPEQLEFLVTDENYYNQFLVLVQKRFSVEFADLNTTNLPVNFATFKKTIYHEEYVKNILLLVCANNENVANKLFQNSELYEAILKHAHFHYFTKSNFRKVCPIRLKAAPVFIKKKFTFEAETAKDNGNAVSVGDSLAEAVSTASSSADTEKTSQHRTAQAENFKILQPKKNQAAENKENAADNSDSLPVNKKSMKCASKAEKVTNQINCQPQTVQTENFQKPKRNPKKTHAIKAQAAKDKENAVDLNDSLPLAAVKRKSTTFSSQPQTVQASPRKAQAVNEESDDDDSLPLAAFKRKSTALSSHVKKTNCQPQTLQAEHFQIPKPIVPNDKGIASDADAFGGISSISADVLHIKQEPVVWLNKLEFTIKDGNSDQFLCTPVEPTIVNLDNSEQNLLPILLNFDDDDGESNARYVVSDINDELENSCDTTASSTFNLAQRLPSSFECESLVNQKSQENHVPSTATTTTTASQAFLRDVNLESSGSGSSGSGIGTDEHSLKQQQHEQQQQTADSEPMLCSEQPAANITSAAMANQTVANDKDVLACNSEMYTQHEELDCATSHSTKTTTNTTGLTKVNRKRTGIFETRVVLKKSKIIDNNANNIIEQLKAATASLPQLQPEFRPLLLQQQQTLKQTANNITEIKTKEKETTASKQLKSATTFVPQLQHGFKQLPLKKKEAKQLTDSHLQTSSSSTTGSTKLMKTITITETVTARPTTKAMLSPKILTHQPPITHNISQEMSKDNSLFNSSEMQRFLEQQNCEQQPAVAADTNSTTSAPMQNQQPQDKVIKASIKPLQKQPQPSQLQKTILYRKFWEINSFSYLNNANIIEYQLPPYSSCGSHHIEGVMACAGAGILSKNFRVDEKTLLNLFPHWSANVKKDFFVILKSLNEYHYNCQKIHSADMDLRCEVLNALLNSAPNFTYLQINYETANPEYAECRAIVPATDPSSYRTPFKCLTQAIDQNVLEKMDRLKKQFAKVKHRL